ncbi:MAG: STAS domain-containing protein, partial [Aggregatilineales bacterium]
QELKEPGTDIALWMSTTKVPLHDAEGNVIGLIGFAEDITERKLAEQMLSHQEKLINDQQEKLLELSTPVLPVSDNILLIPLIGTVDSMRALHIMRTVLSAISTYHARILILDISGMPLIDTSVANDLNRMIQAAALKGTEAIITGVSDAVAETIVDLGVDWSEIETLRDLQSGIQRALQKQHGL